MISRLCGVPGGTIFPRARGVDMAPGGSGIHADLPGQFPFLLGVGEQPGVHVGPHPVGPQTNEQMVDPPPRPVTFMNIPPRATSPNTEEDAVDQGS